MSSSSGTASNNNTFEKFALGINEALIAVGVVGLFYLAINVGKLDERVGVWTTVYEHRMEAFDRKLERHTDQIEELYRRRSYKQTVPPTPQSPSLPAPPQTSVIPHRASQ